MTAQKPVYMPMELSFLGVCVWGLGGEKSMCLPHVSLIFEKKSVLKLLDHTVYFKTAFPFPSLFQHLKPVII